MFRLSTWRAADKTELLHAGLEFRLFSLGLRVSSFGFEAGAAAAMTVRSRRRSSSSHERIVQTRGKKEKNKMMMMMMMMMMMIMMMMIMMMMMMMMMICTVPWNMQHQYTREGLGLLAARDTHAASLAAQKICPS